MLRCELHARVDGHFQRYLGSVLALVFETCKLNTLEDYSLSGVSVVRLLVNVPHLWAPFQRLRLRDVLPHGGRGLCGYHDESGKGERRGQCRTALLRSWPRVANWSPYCDSRGTLESPSASHVQPVSC